MRLSGGRSRQRIWGAGDRPTCRECHGYRGSFAQGAFEPQAAAVQFHEGSREGKTVSGSFVAAGKTVVELSKGLHCQRDVGGRHADARILNDEIDSSVRGILDLQQDMALHWREFERVGE